MDASKHDRNAGTAVFVQKGNTLKVMEEFNTQGKQFLFTSTVLEILDTSLYIYTVGRVSSVCTLCTIYTVCTVCTVCSVYSMYLMHGMFNMYNMYSVYSM